LAQAVSCEIKERVALLHLSNPPINALAAPLRQSLAQWLSDLADDHSVDAVVIAAKGSVFSIGLDIRELDEPIKPPSLSEGCTLIDDFPKPVVAALQGMVLGGGMELALACHGRVAQGQTTIGFPDISLGLSPAAGGTQLLPRLVGAKTALDLLLSGRSMSVRGDEFSNIFNRIVDDGEEEAALSLALSMVGAVQPSSARTDGFAEGATYQAEIRERRKALDRGGLADVAERIVDCVEAAQLLPYHAGLEFEAAAFDDCLASDQSRALRHAYFAERRTANMPELGVKKENEIKVVGVVGGGPAAAMIALACLDAGRNVVLFERNADAIEAARGRITAVYDTAISARRITISARDERMAQLRFTDGLGDLSGADLIIEAVADNPQTKTQVFAAIGRIAGPQTTLATNSLILPIGPIAARSGCPNRFLGLHMHMPAHVNRLAEVIVHERTDEQAVADVVGLLHRMNKIAVHVAGGHGGVGERIIAALRDACTGMLRMGTDAWDVDKALKTYGFSMGPLQQMDMVGLDTCLARARAMSGAEGFAQAHITLLEEMVAAGRLGVKSGQGFHDWRDGNGVPKADPTLGDVLNAEGKALKSGEILLRSVAAMANAGARALRAEVALRPSDIDTVMIHAYHYPRWRGGPMKAADLLGIFELQQALKGLAAENPVLYTPDPGFAALARNHENFEALNKLGRKRRKIPDSA